MSYDLLYIYNYDNLATLFCANVTEIVNLGKVRFG